MNGVLVLGYFVSNVDLISYQFQIIHSCQEPQIFVFSGLVLALQFATEGLDTFDVGLGNDGLGYVTCYILSVSGLTPFPLYLTFICKNIDQIFSRILLLHFYLTSLHPYQYHYLSIYLHYIYI